MRRLPAEYSKGKAAYVRHQAPFSGSAFLALRMWCLPGSVKHIKTNTGLPPHLREFKCYDTIW